MRTILSNSLRVVSCLFSAMPSMSCASFSIWFEERGKKQKAILKHLNLIRAMLHFSVFVCLCHHKTIGSVGWVLLMQVNIASRAAILIMGNIIHNISDEYELLAKPTKLRAHSVEDAFSFTPSLHTTLNYWHRWENVYTSLLLLLFNSIQEGMGGRGK